MLRSYFLVFLALISTWAIPKASYAKLVDYELTIKAATVNFTGQPVEALTVNGGIPAPLIEATIGDTLRVTVYNQLNTVSSIHWHGILLPNEQDGVPFLTTQPIAAGGSHTFEFPVVHTGTYWYHSHTGLQEQRGVYGPIVFHAANRTSTQEEVIVFSDWIDENPHTVLSNLKKDGDYYALKKNSVQSWDKVVTHGWQAIKNRISGAWSRMGPMHISDIGYDAFLANGKREDSVPVPHGSRVKLRLINAAASSYFNIEYANGPMTIIAADGIAVTPVKVQRFKMAIAETYDILIEAPHVGTAELRATSEDGTGHSSIFIGPDTKGPQMLAPDIPAPNPYLNSHNHHTMASMSSNMDHSQMDHAAMGHDTGQPKPQTKDTTPIIAYMTDYEPLRATVDTRLTAGRPTRDIPLTLTGNMERFVWGFNGKTLLEADKILIKRGENVRFILKNETMMHHPVHLHGHFFRVLTSNGAYSPLKHTVNVPPMGEVTIEFEANEEKDWFFHCHNLYHMKAGMARVISYAGSSKYDDTIRSKIASDPWYYRGNLSVTNNMTFGDIRLSNTRNALTANFDYGFKQNGFEAQATYERTLTRFLDLYVGVNTERHSTGESTETRGIMGVKYILPLLIEAELEIDTNGDVEVGFETELQLTSRLQFDAEWEYDMTHNTSEYRFGLSYELSKRWELNAVHDSDYGTGAGLRMNF